MRLIAVAFYLIHIAFSLFALVLIGLNVVGLTARALNKERSLLDGIH